MLLLEDCLPWLGIWVQRFPFTEEKGGSLSLPFQKVLFISVRNTHRGMGDFDMVLVFKDTVEGCRIPLALQAESNAARERREEEHEDCHSSAETPVTIRGSSFLTVP